MCVMNQPRLTIEATYFLSKDEKLMEEVSVATGIKIYGIKSAVLRRSTTLTTYHAVLLIAEKMNKLPETIVELTE